MVKVHVVIGGSHAGKTSFVVNSFIGDSEMTEFKEDVLITETDKHYLIGPYNSIDGRTKGSDRISRADITKIYNQVVKLAERNDKDVVVEGDKITSRPFMNTLLEADLDINLYWIRCSPETSVERNMKAGSTSKPSHLKGVVTKARNLFNEYKIRCESYIADSDEVEDFTTFDMSYAKKVEHKQTSMRDDFAFFIVSNGRPNAQHTLEQILGAGYTGDWYIVCDNLDSTLPKYKEKYGEHVLVFDKERWAEKTDTFVNEKDLRSVVYARNASIALAQELGYKYMAQFDDDQKRFTIRYEDEGKLKTQLVNTDMNEIISAYVQILEDTRIDIVAMGHGMNYIGGLDGAFQKRMGTWLYSTFFLKVDAGIEFRGLHNEDYILTSHYAKRGTSLYNIFDVQTTDFERGSNEGGLFDLYQAASSYQIAFYAILESPDSTRIRTDRLGKSHISQFQKFRIPRLLNEKWRKVDA